MFTTQEVLKICKILINNSEIFTFRREMGRKLYIEVVFVLPSVCDLA
jgi:hypothetical protein